MERILLPIFFFLSTIALRDDVCVCVCRACVVRASHHILSPQWCWPKFECQFSNDNNLYGWYVSIAIRLPLLAMLFSHFSHSSYLGQSSRDLSTMHIRDMCLCMSVMWTSVSMNNDISFPCNSIFTISKMCCASYTPKIHRTIPYPTNHRSPPLPLFPRQPQSIWIKVLYFY